MSFQKDTCLTLSCQSDPVFDERTLPIGEHVLGKAAVGGWAAPPPGTVVGTVRGALQVPSELRLVVTQKEKQ